MGNCVGGKSKKDPTVLTEEEIKLLLGNTKLNRAQINALHQNFLKECPSGKLTKKDFVKLFKEVHPSENKKEKADKFCEYVFKVIDQDSQGYISFNDFVLCFSLTSYGDFKQKCEFAFKLYDLDKDNLISKKEMTQVLVALYDLSGITDRKKDKAPSKKVEEIIKLINSKTVEQVPAEPEKDPKDPKSKKSKKPKKEKTKNYITKDQFIDACSNDEPLKKLFVDSIFAATPESAEVKEATVDVNATAANIDLNAFALDSPAIEITSNSKVECFEFSSLDAPAESTIEVIAEVPEVCEKCPDKPAEEPVSVTVDASPVSVEVVEKAPELAVCFDYPAGEPTTVSVDATPVSVEAVAESVEATLGDLPSFVTFTSKTEETTTTTSGSGAVNLEVESPVVEITKTTTTTTTSGSPAVNLEFESPVVEVKATSPEKPSFFSKIKSEIAEALPEIEISADAAPETTTVISSKTETDGTTTTTVSTKTENDGNTTTTTSTKTEIVEPAEAKENEENSKVTTVSTKTVSVELQKPVVSVEAIEKEPEIFVCTFDKKPDEVEASGPSIVEKSAPVTVEESAPVTVEESAPVTVEESAPLSLNATIAAVLDKVSNGEDAKVTTVSSTKTDNDGTTIVSTKTVSVELAPVSVETTAPVSLDATIAAVLDTVANNHEEDSKVTSTKTEIHGQTTTTVTTKTEKDGDVTTKTSTKTEIVEPVANNSDEKLKK